MEDDGVATAAEPAPEAEAGEQTAPTPLAEDVPDAAMAGESPERRTFGLHWEKVGASMPTEGRELSNSGLAAALESILESKTEFTQQELEAFGISDVRPHDFIKAGDVYFVSVEAAASADQATVGTAEEEQEAGEAPDAQEEETEGGGEDGRDEDGAAQDALADSGALESPCAEPEPEPVVVELSPEEKLLLCIKWVESRIDFATNAKLSEESRAAISSFVSDAYQDVLYAYHDKESGGVHVRKLPPTTDMCKSSVQYFLKDIDGGGLEGIPHPDMLQRRVFFGYLRADKLCEDLTALVSRLCLPQVRHNRTWPASLTKDLVGSLERFMGNMTDIANLSAGKTILYVPNDDLSQPDACAKDKDLCQRLEASVIHWTRQIKALINGGQGKQVEDSPLGEIDLWKSRCSDLSGLEAQLKAPAVAQVLQVLELAKSSYLEPFQKLATDIEARTAESRDNYNMLKPLMEPCTRLQKCKLEDMPVILEEVMFLVRAIWANSQFLNTADSITGLLRKVSNSLIDRCRETLDLSAIMQGNIAASEHVLQQSVHCGNFWKQLFYTHRKLIAYNLENAEGGGAEAAAAALEDWDESRIFAQMDAFMQRCTDLLEVCEWRSQFSYKLACDADADEEQEVAPQPGADEDDDEEEGSKKKSKPIPQKPPAFGGSRAQEVYGRMLQIRKRFAEHMQALERLSYDPLDVKSPGWHQDFSRLKIHVKDLEVVLNNAIMSAFETVGHTGDAFDLQEAFQHLSTRDTVKRVADKKSQDMVAMWAEDINWVKKCLDKNRKNPPRHMDEPASQYPYRHAAPPFAGAAAWAKALLMRIQVPYEQFQTSHHIVSTNAYLDTLEQYKTVQQAIKAFMETQYEEWQAHMEQVFRGGEDLMASNLVRRDPQTQLLEVTFPLQVALLFKEVEAWERVGYSIPFVAMENAKDKDRINVIRWHVNAMARDYNNILSALEPWERKVFSDKLKALDRKLGPAMSRITWANKGIVDFCRDVRKLCGGSQTVVDDFKAYTTNIARACREMSNLPLVQIEHKKLYGSAEFEAAQTAHRKTVVETLGRLANDIKSSLKSVYVLFMGDGAESMKEWERFITRVDANVEKALCDGAKKSLQSLMRAITGDKKSESQQVPLFLVRVVLDSQNRVAYTPSPSDLMQLVNSCAKELTSMLDVVPRLRHIVELEVRQEVEEGDSARLQALRDKAAQAASSETTISQSIANDEDVTKVMVAIAGGMSANGGKMQKHLSYWEKFKHIWDFDKDAFIRRYAKSSRPLSAFEDDIKRYKDLHKEVSQEEAHADMGFISVDYTGLKADIIGHCLDWQHKFTGLLNDMALKELTSVLDAFATTTQKLQATPRNLNELAEAGKLLKEQAKDLPNVVKLFDPIVAKYKLLEKFEVDVDAAELAKLDSLDSQYETFKAFLASTDKNLGACKRNMKADLDKAAASFQAEAQAMADFFKNEAPSSGEKMSTAEALEQLASLTERLEKNRATEHNLRNGMEIFDQTLEENANMASVESGIALLNEMWGMKGEWDTIWDGYKLGKFAELKTDNMEETAGKFMKKVMMKRKEAGSKPIWSELKLAVDRFRATMPLIADLSNKDLRERHWNMLMEQVGTTFDYQGDDFTLERVIELGLDQHAEFIGSCSASASKEFQVEKSIADIRENWATLQLETVPYRDRGHHRIKTVEDLYAALDDNSVVLGTLKATKFGKPFMDEIVYWEKTLSSVSETLEVSQEVQRQWMYLENIFAGSEDIRRQLPQESAMFEKVDENWMWVMKRFMSHATAKDACTDENCLPKLVEMNSTLEKIQKSLDAYLETKRVAFPRFYFVSADDLLEILGQARDPEAVQPHLKKCFDAIKTLKMDKNARKSIEATGMNSPEGEFVPFQSAVITEGAVEVWMLQVEAAMRLTLHKLLFQTLTAMKSTKKEKWVADWPGQLLITSGQILWTTECEKGLAEVEKGNKLGLKTTKKKWVIMLNKYSEMIRAGMNKQDRSKAVAVVTIEVHARDVIDQLMKRGCSSKTDFDWLAQLRLAWEKDIDKCMVYQISAKFDYGCEYLGNCGRLVITPLTDRAYMTLTTALHLKRGGNPQGPAGTGKTETVKDLGKAIAKYVIVFNCSDGLDFKSMGRMFSGLSQTGAWSCFDEFNRIDIEVLSVVAQQILSILKAVTQGLSEFNFEGTIITLNLGVGIFVTMNPGYAGRTELPDNLKAILRPISMMVPDMALIAEIMLFSEGFTMGKVLAKKMTGLFDLMKEQMSKQDHYDYGLRTFNSLRNTKSILVAAGALKRAEPDMPEDILLYRTIRDMQLPKLIAEDVPLFNALNSDFFPGLEIPPTDYGVFQKAIEASIEKLSLQSEKITIVKIIQVYEVKLTRHGNMLVGASFSAKSTAWKLLQDSHALLKQQGAANFEKVRTYIINPKSLSDAELYGQYDLSTGEWLDGVLSNCMRSACADETPVLKWLVLDGPVDTLWIESMNTVLDDNKLLTLVSGERISMPPQVSLLFEVQDLAVASPATVSRAGMVYFDPSDFGWRPYVKSWLQKTSLVKYVEPLRKLFDQFLDPVLETQRREATEPVPCIQLNLVQSLCNLIEAIFLPANGLPEDGGNDGTQKLVHDWFTFCLVWSLGGAADEPSRKKIDVAIREADAAEGASSLPPSGTMYDWLVDPAKGEWVAWTSRIPENWEVAPKTPFYKILVPTGDTVRYQWVVSQLLAAHKEVLIVGDSGVGKTFIMQEAVSKLKGMLVSKMNFSAQTSSGRVQFIVEGKVEKRMKDTYGPPSGKRMVLMIDDLNMPSKDLFGSQPPLELLRHWLDYGFWYDRQKQFVKYVKDIQLLQVMGYPGGGRSVITMRLQSRSNLLNITFPAEAQLKRIFSLPLQSCLKDFEDEVKGLCEPLTNATIGLYHAVGKELLPTPSRSHYLFNLRDVCKILQGLLQAKPGKGGHDSKTGFLKLWTHECFRVFSDRLIDDQDRVFFQTSIDELLTSDTLSSALSSLFDNKIISIYGDFMSDPGPEQRYEEYSDFPSVKAFCEGRLEEYNYEPGMVPMQLVLFRDAIEHACRIARIIGMQRGNALLVGVGGSGRQSLSRLAAFLKGFKIFTIEITKTYRKAEFHEDLKRLYVQAGVQRKESVFLFSDTQIVEESFLEDINGMLSTGEVPNLYSPDEMGEIREGITQAARAAGVEETSDALYNFFIEQARNHMHVVLCFSPIGDSFRIRCRKFPALVSCTSIDWFSEWPVEALKEVALKFTEEVNLGSDAVKKSVTEMMATAQASVSRVSERMLTELKRVNYVTPTNYLELVTGYLSLLAEQRAKLEDLVKKYVGGVDKIEEAKKEVEEMSKVLVVKKEEVAVASKETEELLVVIVKEKAIADEQEKSVSAEAEKIGKEEAETKIIAQQAQTDLDKAIPALNAAADALNALNKAHISETKNFPKPPPAVEMVMAAVLILRKAPSTAWDEAKRHLSDINFLQQLVDYDKDNMSDKLLQKIDKYMANPDFEPEKVAKVSTAASGLCKWVRAMHLYGNVSKTVAPKREKLKNAMMSLEKKQAALRKAQEELQAVVEKVQELQNKYDNSIATKDRLTSESATLTMKLERADQLVNGLSGERTRWEGSIDGLNKDLENAVGDCAIAAAFLSYAGPFNSDFRYVLVKETWMPMVEKLNIPMSKGFDFASFLAKPTDVREWNLKGLPGDAFSVENGVLVTRGRRWPLMIDPQAQANKWIKNLEAEAGLKAVDLKMSDWMRTMENAIQFGSPVLIQDVLEELDPALEPVLSKSFTKQGNRLVLKLGDKEIDYNEDFRLYLTTKLGNPHYPPEVSTKTTIVNFSIKREGLEDQLLGFIVKKERPDLEEQNAKLVVQVAKGKNQLAELDDKILYLLSTATGSLLDDDELVMTLQSSKKISNEVKEQLKVAEETKITIDVARESYRPSAFRASILYFVLNDLGMVDPMYQFSLSSYVVLFLQSIDRSPKSDKIEDRLKNLNEYHTYAVYQNTCRGLFERHKLLFSLHMCSKILEGAGKINKEEYTFLLRGGQVLNKDMQTPNPAPEWITESSWDNISELSNLPAFRELDASFEHGAEEWHEWFVNSQPEQTPLPGDWQANFSELQRLCLIRSLRPDRVVFASTSFIINNLGAKYVEPPAFDLSGIFSESTCSIPLIFILSPGVDPVQALFQVAASVDMQDSLKTLALGQGQAPIANRLLSEGTKSGHWVFLANCHLMLSWMNSLEKVVEGLAEASPHKDFRLWLSSYPHPKFPISILQAGTKMVTEPPKGLKANMTRLYNKLTPEQFTRCAAGLKYRRLLFCLVFFHAVLVERKKFGTLGYNVPYDFNESDFDISEDCLAYYLAAYDKTPWDALRYLIAEANYGGRVTDGFDFRLVRCYVRSYFQEDAISGECFLLAPPLDYIKVPDDAGSNMKSYTDFIKGLPVLDDPESFGQHSNADISAQINDTNILLDTLSGLQPATGGGGGGEGGGDGRILKMVGDMEENLPPLLDYEQVKKIKQDDQSALHVFLLQEIQRYNKQLKGMAVNLADVKKGIKGLVVMSAELEEIVSCVNVGKVPPSWNKCFPSLKPLANWLRDLASRISSLREWGEGDYPVVYWMSGFSYPTGFLTAILQTAARANAVSVDVLSWEFTTLPTEVKDIAKGPKEGAYIHGMFLEGAAWDWENMCLQDQKPMELVAQMPVVHFRPVESKKKVVKGIYSCPAYMYPVRTGSRERPSYTLSVDLKSGNYDADFWIRRGTAILLSLAS